jgi:hypothetical protein
VQLYEECGCPGQDIVEYFLGKSFNSSSIAGSDIEYTGLVTAYDASGFGSGKGNCKLDASSKRAAAGDGQNHG